MCCAFLYLQRLQGQYPLKISLLILQARSTGKGYLILVRKSASVPSSAEGRSKEALLLFFQYCIVLVFLLIVDVCKCDVKKKIKGSHIPTMIIQTILAMSVSIFQHYCIQSSPSGFHHYQPESAEDSVRPRRWSMATLQKIRVVPHNYPRVSARNNHRIPQKKFFMSCTVPDNVIK